MRNLDKYLPWIIIGAAMLTSGSVSGIGAMIRTRWADPYTPDGKTTFPGSRGRSGVYLIKKGSEVVYVGHSRTNLYRTLYRHFQVWNHPTQSVTTYSKLGGYSVRVIYTTPAQAPRLEAYLVNKLQPRDNQHKLVKYSDGTGEYENELQRAAEVVAPF